MYKTVYFLIFYVHIVHSYNFNTDNVQVIQVPNLKDAYFGYAVMLQKNTPSVIVGAPKQDPVMQKGGQLFRCNLKENNCTNFGIPPVHNSSRNGNSLGSVVNGGEGRIFTCAPNEIQPEGSSYYLKGICYYFDKTNRRSTIIPLQRTKSIGLSDDGQLFFNTAYGQAGFDLEYSESTAEVVLGSPGVRHWNGAIMTVNLQDNTAVLLPKTDKPKEQDTSSYLGYKVAFDKFSKNSNEVWYVAGAPRHSFLKGKVRIFKYDLRTTEKIKDIAYFLGEEIGAYFGSALLVEDVDGDGYKDLFIGAPMGAGKTWEEGYVYYYQNKRLGNFEAPVKIFGSKSTGARFGTVISKLGDIDLDSFNDVAISAPYENDGMGAVYIYRGSKNGISTMFSQKLTPRSFNVPAPGNIKGFGLGLSRGTDIDSNGYNDIAVGAYKSDQVFIVRSKAIVDYKLYLNRNITALQTGSNIFGLEYCLLYSLRLNTVSPRNLSFTTEIILDKRGSTTTNLVKKQRAKGQTRVCSMATVQVNIGVKDFTVPFKILMKAEIDEANFLAYGESAELTIPFSHGCGDDNTCQTNLNIDLKPNLTSVVYGLHKELDVNMLITNHGGEPAYQCEMIIQLPQGIEFRNFGNCNLKNDTYICPVSDVLLEYKVFDLKFDIENLSPDIEYIDIYISVVSSGRNKEGAHDADTLNIPVEFQSSPYMEGSSTPENLEYKKPGHNDIIYVTHKFTVGNSGPSPVRLDVPIKFPTGNTTLMEVVQVTSSLNGINSICNQNHPPTVIPLDESQLKPSLSVPENRTIRLDCLDEKSDCLEYFCNAGYLYKSQNVDFMVKFKINARSLAVKYQKGKEDILAIISTAYLLQDTHTMTANSITLVFIPSEKSVPVWVYVVSTLLGVLLLVLLIFGLFKCKFFDRNYRDKLKEEKLMQLDNEDPEGHTNEASVESSGG